MRTFFNKTSFFGNYETFLFGFFLNAIKQRVLDFFEEIDQFYWSDSCHLPKFDCFYCEKLKINSSAQFWGQWNWNFSWKTREVEFSVEKYDIRPAFQHVIWLGNSNLAAKSRNKANWKLAKSFLRFAAKQHSIFYGLRLLSFFVILTKTDESFVVWKIWKMQAEFKHSHPHVSQRIVTFDAIT